MALIPLLIAGTGTGSIGWIMGKCGGWRLSPTSHVTPLTSDWKEAVASPEAAGCVNRPDLWQVGIDYGKTETQERYFLVRGRPPDTFHLVSLPDQGTP